MLNLAEIRKSKGISQKELAKYLKISPGNLCEWEKGRIEPNIESLKIIADYFDVSIDYLVGREDDFGVIRSQNAAPALDKDEQELIENFRELNRLQKQKILAYTEGMLAAERQYTKK